MSHLSRRLAALAASLAAVPLLLGGCGGDPEPAPTGGDEPSDAATTTAPSEPTTSSADEGTCTMLSAEAVTAALGEEMVVSVGFPQSCLFSPADPASAASVTASATAIAIDLAEYAAGTRDLCEGEVTEVEAGEVAFACVTFVGPQGYVFEDSTSVLLDVVTGDESESAAVAAAAALLPSVTVP